MFYKVCTFTATAAICYGAYSVADAAYEFKHTNTWLRENYPTIIGVSAAAAMFGLTHGGSAALQHAIQQPFAVMKSAIVKVASFGHASGAAVATKGTKVVGVGGAAVLAASMNKKEIEIDFQKKQAEARQGYIQSIIHRWSGY